MILPLTGCNQIVDVSTDNIRVTIKRRKEPSLSSNDFLKQPSKLEIWGCIKELTIGGNQCCEIEGEYYVREDVAPLFFEHSDYIINARSLKGNPLRFDHADKNIRDAISMAFDDPALLNGTINFGSEVGYSNLIFSDDQGNRLVLEIEVFPSKLSYKEDYEAIRNDINEMVEAVAIDFINSTYTHGALSTVRNDVPAIFFSLINQLFGKYYKALSIIMAKPNHKLITEHKVVPAHKVRNVDSKTYQWIAKHPVQAKRVDGNIRVNSALTVQKRITYDTVENQLVKFMLTSTVNKLLDFKRKYLANFKNRDKSADPEVMTRIDEMVSKIKGQLKNPVFEEVSSLRGINTMSLVFQMAPGYRDLYKYYQLLQRGVSFNGEVYNFSLKETSTLYEYWCFIKLVNILKKKYTLLDKEKDVIKASRKGITVTLSKDKKSVVKFIDTKTGDQIELIYNPGKYPTDTVSQIPDNVLSLTKHAGIADKKTQYQYVFDAKYKVEMNPNEYYPDDHPGPKVADINTMHRDRDAIVSTEGKLNEKLMFGAYVLFPYPNQESEYEKHQFYKSIDKVNIGGLPFLPQKTDLVEKLLSKLVGESVESAFERSIFPKGIEEKLAKVDWTKRDVLVGSLSSKKQFEDVLKEKYYYVPINNMPSEKHVINYIALYESWNISGKERGIQLYGEVSYMEIKYRRDINDIPGKNRPDELCYVFTIKSLEQLPVRIGYELEWVYRPRYTNLFLLCNCRKSYELFNIRSEEDYRLVLELRRIEANIKVEDNPKELFIRFNENISIYNDEENIRVFAYRKEILRKSTAMFAHSPGEVFREIREYIDM